MIFSTHSLTFRRLWYKEGRRRSGQVPFLLAERARSECARSMGALKGSLTTPYQRGEERIRKALAWANGTSREIDCEAIGG